MSRSRTDKYLYEWRQTMLFAESRAFQTELTALYDFINPTGAAIWNLRWQVAGYLTERPDATVADLQARFVKGSDIGSTNLKRHCIETPWERQLQQLGALALYQAIGHFESWVESLPVGSKRDRKALMFPSWSDERSAQDFIAGLPPSSAIEPIYGPGLEANRHCLPDRLEDLLTVFRAYKIARNSITHTGGRPSASTAEVLTRAAAASHGFGHGGKPLQLPRLDHDRVVIDLLGALGACAVVLKLVATLDRVLLDTAAAEAAVVQQWRTSHSRTTLSANTSRRAARLRVLSVRAGLPKPADYTALYNVLSRAHLVI